MKGKRLLAVALSLVLAFQGFGCSAPATDGSEAPAPSDEQNSEAQIEDSAGTGRSSSTEQVHEFASLDDENLKGYLQDEVYSELIDRLDSDGYFVENVEATYVSKEYLDELSYNSRENIYFGYNLADLQSQFRGTHYVFALGDDGQTTVHATADYDDTYDEVVRNVAIGSGVILVCVTVSAVTGGAAPAVSMVFALSAQSGTVAGLSCGAISAASAGIVTAIETNGDMDEAMKSAALAGSEGFSMGAIAGAIGGGANEAAGLKGATLNGLTVNEAATIQRDSKYPLELVKSMHSIDEYQVYRDAGLKAEMVGDRMALVQDIDLKRVDEHGLTNLERMGTGLAPLDSNGESYELHHIGQGSDSPLAILTQDEHRGKGRFSILHDLTKDSEVHGSATTDAAWEKTKRDFWKNYAAQYA